MYFGGDMMADVRMRLYGSGGNIYKKVYRDCIWRRAKDGSIDIMKREENPQYKKWYADKMNNPLSTYGGYVEPYNTTFIISYGPTAWHSVE
jgi:hypothetical protein